VTEGRVNIANARGSRGRTVSVCKCSCILWIQRAVHLPASPRGRKKKGRKEKEFSLARGRSNLRSPETKLESAPLHFLRRERERERKKEREKENYNFLFAADTMGAV
jgi:hypothetical protein